MKQVKTRRSFLKNTTLGIAGMGLGLSATCKETFSGSKKNSVKGANLYQLERSIPIEDGFDIVVAGGGPSGCSAAISAARLGAKVLLVEATGCLGGMGTSGLVSAWPSIGDDEKIIVGGIFLEIVTELYDKGYLGLDDKPEKFHRDWIQFNPEGYKLLLDQKVTESGIDLRFFTRLIDVDSDPESRKVNGIIIHNIDGYKYIKAKAFIDCTGDAVLAALAGAECREAGKDTENIMPASLLPVFTNIDFGKAKYGGTNSQYLLKAISDGHFSNPDYHMTGMYRTGRTTGTLNGGHIFDMNALRNIDKTNGIITGRKIAEELYTYYKKYVPGYENIDMVCTASLLGVRESRRIVGEYELNFDDFKTSREFPDQIGIFRYPVDIHPYKSTKQALSQHTNEFNHSGKLEPGKHYGLPYSILVPKGWENLWVAGRSVSSDIFVNSSLRVQPSCYMMGQAAGAAGVQAIRNSETASKLNTKQLIETLRADGANLPQSKLSETMTRS